MAGSDATSRLAELCSSITAWSKSECKSWARQQKINWDLPVCDAEIEGQRALESNILQTAANTFQHSQLIIPKVLVMAVQEPQRLRLMGAGKLGAVYGVLRARPTASEVMLHLHPKMASRWVASVLPSEDGQGGIMGVAALRPRPHEKGTELVDIVSEANVLLQGIQYASLREILPSWYMDSDPTWLKYPNSLTEGEKESITHQQKARKRAQAFSSSTALINSRILRRPALVNRIAVHGFVNSYRGIDGNPKFEWCCGPSETNFRQDLRDSGLWAEPWPLTQASPTDYPGPEKATVSLRWSSTCFMSPGDINEIGQQIAASYRTDANSEAS